MSQFKEHNPDKESFVSARDQTHASKMGKVPLNQSATKVIGHSYNRGVPPGSAAAHRINIASYAFSPAVLPRE